MWKGCVITWDGKIVPCCFDKDASHTLGSLAETDFNTVWNSPAYDAFRATVLGSRKDVDICRNCSEGVKVWA
jgi:radical SAM protein with 4Fe4S-binding SPASM domain